MSEKTVDVGSTFETIDHNIRIILFMAAAEYKVNKLEFSIDTEAHICRWTLKTDDRGEIVVTLTGEGLAIRDTLSPRSETQDPTTASRIVSSINSMYPNPSSRPAVSIVTVRTIQ